MIDNHQAMQRALVYTASLQFALSFVAYCLHCTRHKPCRAATFFTIAVAVFSNCTDQTGLTKIVSRNPSVHVQSLSKKR
jgi:hypothetical protein